MTPQLLWERRPWQHNDVDKQRVAQIVHGQLKAAFRVSGCTAGMVSVTLIMISKQSVTDSVDKQRGWQRGQLLIQHAI